MKSPTPVTHHQPTITVKIKNISINSNIGQDWSIEILPKGFGVGVCKARRGKQNTFILQKSWDTQKPPTVTVEIKITERDKIDDIFGPEVFDLQLNKTLPINNDPQPNVITGHRKGQKIIEIMVQGKGGDKGKTAFIQITFEWLISSNMYDLVSYIDIEMTNNLLTPEFAKLKKILAIANTLKHTNNYLLASTLQLVGVNLELSNSEAYLNFKNLVGYGNQWDHKKPIYNVCGEFSLDSEKGMWYRYDIFSNIHYGYIGRAAGFSSGELLDGAGLAQALHDKKYDKIAENITNLKSLDDPTDQEAIQLGIDLWDHYHTGISKEIILKKMQDKKKWHKGRKPSDEGIAPKH
jgi:hypothetical protein